MIIDRLEKREKEWMFDPKAEEFIEDAFNLLARFLRKTYPSLLTAPYTSEQFLTGEIILAPDEFFSGPLLNAIRQEPTRFMMFLDQGMVLERQRNRKVLYAHRDDYNLRFKKGSPGRAMTEAQLAGRILEIATSFWPRVVVATKLPLCLANELKTRYYNNKKQDVETAVPTYPRAMFENLTRDEYTQLLARLAQEGKILPAKKYRELLTRGNNDPPEGEERYIVLTGARIHLCTINKEGLLIPYASLGVQFDKIMCQHLIAWSLSRKLVTEHVTHRFGPGVHYLYKRPSEPPSNILARQWAQKILAKLGFRVHPVMGDFPLYRAYFESQIGQAVIREFGKTRPAMTMEEYLDAQVPEKPTK